MKQRGLLNWLVGNAAILLLVAIPTGTFGFDDTTGSLPPPSSGTYEYAPPGSFTPDSPSFPSEGESYTDPILGETVTRLTDEYPPSPSGDGQTVLYNQTMVSRRGTYYAHTNVWDGHWWIRRVNDNSVVRSEIILDNDEVMFSLDDDDVMFFLAGSSVMKYLIGTDTKSTIRDFGGSLNNGGSCNFASNDGRFFAASAGSRMRFYDQQEDVFYSNEPSDCSGFDFMAIAPDGSGAICVGTRTWWYPVDHSANSWGSARELYDSGPHCDLVTASDGHTYLIVPEPNGTKACGQSGFDQSDEIYRIRVDCQDSSTIVDRNHAQSCIGNGRALPPNQDWYAVFGYSNESSLPATPWSSWSPFKAEIYLVNVLSGAVRRLAHNRSRVVNWDYAAQPHGSLSPDGQYVIFDSNMGRTSGNYKDVYRVTTGLDDPREAPAPPSNLRIID